MNRDKLQENFILWDLQQMSVDDLEKFFINTQMAELDCLDDNELIAEVRQYAPGLTDA